MKTSCSTKKRETIQTAIYLDKEVINNIERIDFVNNILFLQ